MIKEVNYVYEMEDPHVCVLTKYLNMYLFGTHYGVLDEGGKI